MNLNKVSTSLLVVAFGISAVLIITLSGFYGINPLTKAFAATDQIYQAKLSGSSEDPPVKTGASGDAKFTVKSDGKTVEYTINVKDMDQVTGAHIHKGKSNENGQVVATLFNPSKPAGKINGHLASGTFTASDLEGPLKGKQISDLVDLIKNKDAYTNVHTSQNPKGEIRGSIE